MSFVIAVPEVTHAATSLKSLGSTINAAAAVPTAGGADPTTLYTQTITDTTAREYTPYTLPAAGRINFNSGNYPYTEMPIYTWFSPAGTGTTILISNFRKASRKPVKRQRYSLSLV